MSGDGFHVCTDELKTHAVLVQAVATDVATAASAAGTERAGGMVYGVLFDALAQPFLNMWADHMQDLITQNSELAQAISGAIAANAATYDGVEQANKQTITNSGGGGR
ncbi:MAG: type VII secretion target [Jatrophihabitantaceae bacterium]